MVYFLNDGQVFDYGPMILCEKVLSCHPLTRSFPTIRHRPSIHRAAWICSTIAVGLSRRIDRFERSGVYPIDVAQWRSNTKVLEWSSSEPDIHCHPSPPLSRNAFGRRQSREQGVDIIYSTPPHLHPRPVDPRHQRLGPEGRGICG